MLSFATRIGYLSINIGSFLKAPKVKETLAQLILSRSECRSLIEATNNDRDRCVLSLMYACGLRVSEVYGLTWSDLNNGKATVFGKGGKTRTVIIPPSLWSLLISLPQTHDAVFISYRGKPLERTYIHKLIKRCCEVSGVSQKASSHWLRHSHASHAIDQGCNLRVL